MAEVDLTEVSGAISYIAILVGVILSIIGMHRGSVDLGMSGLAAMYIAWLFK